VCGMCDLFASGLGVSVCGVCAFWCVCVCVCGVCVCGCVCVWCACVSCVCGVCVLCFCVWGFLLHSMPHYTVILHALHNLRFN